jgi:hypothetical protein
LCVGLLACASSSSEIANSEIANSEIANSIFVDEDELAELAISVDEDVQVRREIGFKKIF